METENGNDMVDEEDEVIRELDVYLKEDLELYLAQFPLKPVYSNPLNVNSVRYKPNHHKIELNIPYPPSIQQSLAKEQSLAGNHSSQTEHSQKMLSTEIKQENPLMVGFIQNNNFYLSPVNHVLKFHPQMNTSLSMLKNNIEIMMDSDDIAADPDLAGMELMDDGGESSSLNKTAGGLGGENVKQIQLKRKESERAQNARLQSYSHIKQQEELEQWISLKPFPIGNCTLGVLPFSLTHSRFCLIFLFSPL
jgi:hypothetical protein